MANPLERVLIIKQEMTMRINKYQLFATLFIISTGCVSMHNDVYNNSLEYVNDIRLEVSFPDSDSTLDEEVFKALIANVDTGVILYEHLMEPVSKELSNTLFLGWYKNVWERDFEPYINYDSTYRVFEYFLSDCKEQETFYYIGKVCLSGNYDSYIVATTESDEKQQRWVALTKECPELALLPDSIYKRIFIVNVKNSLMVSMTMLWWAWDNEINPRFTYTTISKRGVFLQRESNIFSADYHGFRLFNPETWFLFDPTKGVRFKFDSNGRVVVV